MKKIITAADPFDNDEQDWVPYDEARKKKKEKESESDKKKEPEEDKK